MKHANYCIVEDDYLQEAPLVIRDVGPWNQHPTVTNDAENVVAELVQKGMIPEGRKLLCYDSDDQLDELVVKNGQFSGFAPGPRASQA